jgi:hypothetical protein
MNNYEQLLQDLLFGAKDLIDKVNNISDQFDMSIRLAEQITKAMKVMNKQQEVVIQPIMENKAVEAVKQASLALSRKQYESLLGYPISDEAYNEYVDIFNRQANGEEINLFIPDEDGLMPIPEGAVVSLAVQENPAYKAAVETQETIETVIEEDEVEEVVEVQEEAEEVIEEPAVVEEEAVELTLEQAVEEALSAPDGVEIDIDEDLNEEQSYIAEIDGEEFDVTEQCNIIKELNANLQYDELLERAVDWIEFGINKETYDMLNFIADESAEIIQCKTYLAYYIDAMEIDSIVYYINYFASNVEEDEEGNEIYVNEELQLEFLNKDNISAFLEYLQQLQ